MDNETKVVETKETTVEKHVVHEETVPEPKPRHGETVTIETHTEG